MKILFIVPLSPPLTGQSVACEALLGELRKRHTVEVINFSKGHLRRGINSFARINEVLITLKKIRRRNSNTDVIYLTISQSIAGNLKDLFIYSICFKKLGNMVVHLHGGGIREILFDRFPVLYHLNKFFLRRIGAAVVLSRSLVRIFDGMIPPERIYTVSNFAEDDVFLTADDIRRKFANLSRLKILFLSNLIPGKGFEELAEAYNLLDSSSQKKVRMDFAGDFESDQQKRIFLDKIKNRQGLCYHGMVRGEKKKQLFAEAHVFCLPTYTYGEGQPISILEAYAAGCAVITTDHGGIADIFESGRTGFLVEKKSAKSIAHTLENILAKPEQLERIGNYNNSLARNLYTKSKYLSSLVDIVEQKAQ